MYPCRLACALSLVALAAGCGDKNPIRHTSLALPVPVVTVLAITGADAVLTGLSADYTLTVTLSDGTTRTVTPVWTSSNPGVAGVDGTGRLDGRTHGSTNLTATYESRSVSKTVQVVNNYGGTWQGRSVIRACSDTGDLTDHDGGWCQAGPGRVGTVSSITMILVQSDKNLSEITRTFVGPTYPHVPDPITGVVASDGRLTLAATTWTITDFDYPTIILAIEQVSPQHLDLDGAVSMVGRWSEDLTSYVGRKGTAHTEHELVTMTRVPTSVLAASAIQGVR